MGVWENLGDMAELVFAGDMSPAEEVSWMPEGRKARPVMAVVELDNRDYRRDSAGEHDVQTGRVTFLADDVGQVNLDDKVAIRRRGKSLLFEVRSVPEETAAHIVVEIGRSKRSRLQSAEDVAARF